MKFGPVPTDDAKGAILAHSVRAGTHRLRKGRTLTQKDIDLLRAADVVEVTVARLEDGDMTEDAAAARIAATLAGDGMTRSAPFTGRANLFAETAGLLSVDRATVDRLNGISPDITLATLPHMARVARHQMLATIKIIPYGVEARLVDQAVAAASGAIRFHPFRPLRAALVQTTLPGLSAKVLAKGERITMERLGRIGVSLDQVTSCAHATADIAAAIAASDADMVLVLGASATSDAADVCPAGLIAAGGKLTRFGMPVDPGNLLFLGEHRGRPVVGLPGCARSPALNGADWVLERLAAGLTITSADIAAMGVGGLLKEISTRPQPRSGNPTVPTRPFVEAIILAAGASSRMRGRDKLLETIDDMPQLARIAATACGSGVDRVQVVLPAAAPDRRAALRELNVTVTEAVDAREGMGASIRAGLAARSAKADAVVLILADMPDLQADHIDRLIAAFDPAEGRTIIQATDAEGTPGHPVLFGKRFFESLSQLTGDRGARSVLAEGAEFLTQVPLPDRAATTDLDTPEDWAAWRAARSD